MIVRDHHPPHQIISIIVEQIQSALNTFNLGDAPTFQATNPAQQCLDFRPILRQRSLLPEKQESGCCDQDALSRHARGGVEMQTDFQWRGYGILVGSNLVS